MTENLRHVCVFPFQYKRHTYHKCTYSDAINNKAWCAINVKQFSDVTNEHWHRAACQDECPKTSKN